MDIKDLIVRYGLVFPRRFYPKEKLRFLRGLAQEFHDAGMKVDIKEARKNQRKAYNIYAGDIDRAGLTISAYYDTPPKTFGLIKHYVFCPKRDGIEFMLSLLAPYLVVIAAAALYSNFILMPILSDNSFTYMDVLASVPILILLLSLMYFRNGAGNKPNLVRNSAAIIVCVKLTESLKAKELNRISMAFTDYGCVNHYGDKMLKDALAGNAGRNTVIFLDCVGGSGDVIVLYSGACSGHIEKIRQTAPDNVVFYEIAADNAHYYSLFNKSIILTSGKMKNSMATADYVNTSKDNNINEENLNTSIDILKRLTSTYMTASK